VSDWGDPDVLALPYGEGMAVGIAYPQEPKRLLMLGLGGGTLSTYFGRAMPDLAIDTVEIDRRVIEVAKQYFGLRESERVRYVDSDGRVYLKPTKSLYHPILLHPLLRP